MGKVEVGVGEDFPVDEGKPKEEGVRAEGARGGDCPDRDAWREHRREWKQRWRDHMRERGFRYEDYGHQGRGHRRFGRGYGLKALAVLGALALVIFVVSHLFYILVGAAAVAVLFAAYQHHHHGRRWEMNTRAPSEQK